MVVDLQINNKLIRPAVAPYDSEINEFILSHLKSIDLDLNLNDYISTYTQWIKKSKLNNIKGLDSFSNHYITLGTTQAFDLMYLVAANRKQTIKMYKGEYPYHRDTLNDEQFGFIEDTGLNKDDIFLISHPFSGTGNIHNEFNDTIKFCKKHDIKIWLDMAFFGSCQNIDIDLNDNNIEFVCFSLSKSISHYRFRTGLMFCKSIVPQFHKIMEYDYHIGFNAYLGQELMRNFNSDWRYNKYSKLQKSICDEYGLTPSQVVFLATGDDSWCYYQRDKKYNRICLSPLMEDKCKEI